MLNKRLVYKGLSTDDVNKYDIVEEELNDELEPHQVCVQVTSCVWRTCDNKISKLLFNKDLSKVSCTALRILV